MKLFGSLKELVDIVFRSNTKQVTLQPPASPAADRTLILPDTSDTLVALDLAQTLKNKTIDGDDNTIQDVGISSLKTVLADANKAIVRDASGAVVSSLIGNDNVGTGIDAAKIADGSVSNTEFQYLGNVTSDVQTQLNNKQPLDSDLTAIAAISSNGLIARTGAGTAEARTLTAGSSKLSISNGDGVSGNPTLDVSEANLTLDNISGTLSSTKGGTGVNNAGTLTYGANNITLTTSGVTSLTVPTSGTVATVAGTETLLNKTTISSTGAATGALTLPSGTAAQQPGQSGQPTAVDGMIRYNTDTKSFEGYASGAWSGIGGGGTTDKFTQASPSLAVGDVVYLNGSVYTKAIATSAVAAEVVGVISRGPSELGTNNYEVTLSGEVSGLSGLVSGEVYFLSPSTAGALTVTEPSTIGQISVPVGIASSTTTLYVAPKRGIVVGGTNARTEISLSNNASTSIFNPAAYEAGELSGWVTIDGTLDYRFYISIKFSKKINNSDIDVSYQTSGDTPPAGFSVQYSSGPAQITVTLPNVGGFVTARINYALNAPAVGATFPLSIDSTSVSFSSIQAKDSSGLTFRENDGASVGTVSDAGLWTLPSLTVTGAFVPSTVTGFRNVVINGSMVINQRGRDILRAATSTADDVQNIDRWIGYSTNQLHNSNRTLRVSQVTNDSPSTVPTNRCAAMVTENAADIGTLGLGQKIESSVACGLKNSSNQFTVSFWIKRTSSVGTTAKLCATVNAPASTDAWGGTFLRDSTNQISIIDDFGNLTLNQWVRRTATFNWVSDFDKGIGLLITVGHSQDGYTGATRPALVQNAECYRITGIQLEPGSVATPFEYVSFDHELRRCQRYFQVLAEPDLDYAGAIAEWGLNTANSLVAISIPTRTSMRASPSYWEHQTSAGNTTRARLVGSGLSNLYPPYIAGVYNVTAAFFYGGGTTSDVVALVLAMTPSQNFTNIPTWDTVGGGWRLSANAELV